MIIKNIYTVYIGRAGDLLVLKMPPKLLIDNISLPFIDEVEGKQTWICVSTRCLKMSFDWNEWMVSGEKTFRLP